jgi:hypothetical protein
MKKSRLLEIIREEIAGALSEVSTVITIKKVKPPNSHLIPQMKKSLYMNTVKKILTSTNIETTGKTS